MPKTTDAPRLRCDQCQLLRINGVVCHETGCPNEDARYDVELERWVRQYKCFICGYKADVGDECCNAIELDEMPELFALVCVRCNIHDRDDDGDFDGLCASCRMLDETTDDDYPDDDYPDDDTNSPRYCSLHDTFPLPGDTCEECIANDEPDTDR